MSKERLSWKVEGAEERRREMEWFAKESAAYAGQWVALDGARLVAHGVTLAGVSDAARKAGVEHPLFAYVPIDDLPSGGWLGA